MNSPISHKALYVRRALQRFGLSPATCAGALAVSLLLQACSPASSTAATAKASAPVAVGVHEIKPETVTLTTELPGRTTAPLVAEIRPQVGGIIRNRSFTEGTLVKAGQALYQIDPATYEATYASTQAALLKAKATLESAELTAQRQDALLKIDAVSQQDAQNARAALKQAQADVATAQAAVMTARINLERTVVRAPISGIADVSTATTGALVTADQATALTTVRQTDPIQIDISQSSAEWLTLQRRLASGKGKAADATTASVRLMLEDGTIYPQPGTLKVRGVSVNTSTGAVTLRATFPNPKGLLMTGMYVRAVLPTEVVDNALLVPQQAVSRDSRNGTSVLVVSQDGKVEKRTVTLDRTVGNQWLVASGLGKGDRVVVEGSQKVRVGDVVQTHAVDLTALSSTSAPATQAIASQ
ncbi:efflux RND transporter periplasmic adaptor subunit (plasmid) [Acidovorax sp. DW039]|uniref:efflux RND transporter periplasmic adaptor subunit n=1 Tax=Acidovorax sp. DW039 TaxID=3095606 RepID=UPI00308FC75A|nr:efflux RND transporter periplasmic adaptor subunit [Acidovorax sp. DW039]